MSGEGSVASRGAGLAGAPQADGPYVTSTSPGPHSNDPALVVISLNLSEPVVDEGARDPATYSLLYLGTDRAPGGGDDAGIEVAPAYETGTTQVDLQAAVPLSEGRYQLTALGGTTTGLRDLEGNPLDQDQDGQPNDFVTSLEIDVTAPVVESIEPGAALRFDGQNDYVEIPATSAPEFTGEATIELWFSYAGDGPGQMVVQNLGSTGISFYLNRFTTGGALFLFDGDSTNDTVDFRAGLNDGRWHHAAGVLKEGEVSIFIDGQLAGTKTESLVTTSQNGFLGSVNGESSFFGGLISDLRLWDVARTELEIQGSMAQRLAGSEPGLVGYWPLDEGVGRAITDLSPGGTHGQFGGDSPATHPAWVGSPAPIPQDRIQVVFVDVGGIDPASVTDPANYRLMASVVTQRLRTATRSMFRVGCQRRSLIPNLGRRSFGMRSRLRRTTTS